MVCLDRINKLKKKEMRDMLITMLLTNSNSWICYNLLGREHGSIARVMILQFTTWQQLMKGTFDAC